MMIVIKHEDRITPEDLIEGINEMDYPKRRYLLQNIKLDTDLHKNKVLLYKSVNKINEHPLTIEQRAVLVNFYNQQIKFLKKLS